MFYAANEGKLFRVEGDRNQVLETGLGLVFNVELGFIEAHGEAKSVCEHMAYRDVRDELEVITLDPEFCNAAILNEVNDFITHGGDYRLFRRNVAYLSVRH